MDKTQRKRLSFKFSDTFKEYTAEVKGSVTLDNVRNMIVNMYRLRPKEFKLLYKNKDTAELSNLQLKDLFRKSSEVQLFVKILKEDVAAESNTKMRYMLDCTVHQGENAHFYCFDCGTSICNLCLSRHSTHQTADKYAYGNSSTTLINSIIEELSSKIALTDKKLADFESDSRKKDEFLATLDKVKRAYECTYEKIKNTAVEYTQRKLHEFKAEFKRMVDLCKSSLENGESKKLSDYVVLEEKHFLGLYELCSKLAENKCKLLEWIDTIEEEMSDDQKDYRFFVSEALSKLDALSEHITVREGHLSESIKFKRTSTKLLPQYSFSKEEYSNTILRRKLKTNDICVFNAETNEGKLIPFKLPGNKGFEPFSMTTIVKDSLYISGGKDKEGGSIDTFYKFSYSEKKVQQLASMNKGRFSHAIVFVPKMNAFYVAGGTNNASCEKYSVEQDKWTEIASLNTSERQASTLIVVNESMLYLCFGFSNQETLNFFERYDTLKASEWEQLPTPKGNFPRFNVGYIPLSDSEILFVGGTLLDRQLTSDILLYNVDSNNLELSQLKLSYPTSFIEKQFVEYKSREFCQFETRVQFVCFFDFKNLEFESRKVYFK